MTAIWQLVVAIAIAWASLPYMTGRFFLINPFEYKTELAFIGANGNNATTVSLPTGSAAGDLAIVFCVSGVATTSVASGWQGWSDTLAGGATSWGYKLLTASDITAGDVGTWTNSARTSVLVYRNAMFNSFVGVNGASSGSGTISALSRGSYTVAWLWVNATNIKGSSVTGLTNRSSTNPIAVQDVYLGDCSGSFAGGTLGSGLWRSYTVAIATHFDVSPITGGVLFEDDDYWYVSFLASGTATSVVPCVADALLIGGGGGGGTEAGGGGGAGAVRLVTGITVSSNTALTVGTGGPGGAAGANNSGTSGNDTTFMGNTANGGGFGGKAGAVGGNSANGSGGGGGGRPNIAGGTAGAFGSAGGHSYTPNTAGAGKGGGGGGSTGAGVSGDLNANGGAGDVSTYAAFMHKSFINAAGTNYGVGGGGGGGARSTPGGNGSASSGGGAGGTQPNNAGSNGVAGTGGGGGGAAWNGTTGAEPKGGNGGNGQVVLRIPK